MRLRIFSKIFLSNKFEMEQNRSGHVFQDSKSSRKLLKKVCFREYFLDREDSDSRNFVISQERKSSAKMRNFREICEIYGFKPKSVFKTFNTNIPSRTKGGDLYPENTRNLM